MESIYVWYIIIQIHEPCKNSGTLSLVNVALEVIFKSFYSQIFGLI